VAAKKSKNEQHGQFALTGSEEKPLYEFQEEDGLQEKTWFRRAVDAGLRYSKQFSEKSGLKVIPELEIFSDSEPRPLSAKKLPPPPDDREEAGGAPRRAPGVAGRPKTPRAAGGGVPNPAARAAPAPASDASPAFGPPEKTLFKTAINAFMEQEEVKQARRPAPSRRSAYATRPVQIYYQPQAPSLLSRALKWTLVITILGGVVFGVLTIDRRYHISDTLMALKARSQSDTSRGEQRRRKTKDATATGTATGAGSGSAAGAPSPAGDMKKDD
jgi:hypothetical protein